MKKFILILVVLFSYSISNAQLGRYLVKKATKSNKPLELDWTVFDQEPAVTFYSIIDGVELFNSGLLRFSFFTGTFISYKQSNGKTFSAIEDEEKFMYIKAYKDDEFLDTYVMSLGQGSLGDKRIQMVNNTGDINVAEHGVGTYRFDFFAGDRMYYTFDFETSKVTNDDSYADLKEMYLADGPWNDYIYLKNNSSGSIEFGVYLRHTEFKPNPAKPRDLRKFVHWYMKLYRGTELIGTSLKSRDKAEDDLSNQRTANLTRGEWKDFSSTIVLNDKVDNNDVYAPFSGLDDGNYRVEMHIEGEETPRNYHFDVMNNKIVLPDYQDRAKNSDPTRLIEGWNNYVFLKKAK